MVLGGLVLINLGEYTKKEFQQALAIRASICMLVVLPMPFLDDFFVFGTLTLLLLFLGGFGRFGFGLLLLGNFRFGNHFLNGF